VKQERVIAQLAWECVKRRGNQVIKANIIKQIHRRIIGKLQRHNEKVELYLDVPSVKVNKELIKVIGDSLEKIYHRIADAAKKSQKIKYVLH